MTPKRQLGARIITATRNGIPFDDGEAHNHQAGIRLGSPASTTAGFGAARVRPDADWIVEVVDGLAPNGPEGNARSRPK